MFHGCISDMGEGVIKSEQFADVICTCPTGKDLLTQPEVLGNLNNPRRDARRQKNGYGIAGKDSCNQVDESSNWLIVSTH